MTTTCDFEVRRLHEREQQPALERFAGLHYRSGTPATFAQVLGAYEGEGESARCVGLLCVSRPTLNGPWRARAWPDLFESIRDPRALANALNLYVRTISRVIVHPSYRGVGVASLLIRTYLDYPLTPLTETLSAMGRVSPLFQRCGMREVACPRSRRDRRLAIALRHRGLSPLRLVCIDQASAALRRDTELAREVRAWTRGSRSTRGREPAESDHAAIAELLVLASAGLVARPLVFVTP